MSYILTVTLNPCIDRTISFESFKSGSQTALSFKGSLAMRLPPEVQRHPRKALRSALWTRYFLEKKL